MFEYIGSLYVCIDHHYLIHLQVASILAAGKGIEIHDAP